MEERVQTFVKNGEKLITERHAESPHIQSLISELLDKWNNLKNHAKTARNLVDLTVPYFQLVEEVSVLMIKHVN